MPSLTPLHPREPQLRGQLWPQTVGFWVPELDPSRRINPSDGTPCVCTGKSSRSKSQVEKQRYLPMKKGISAPRLAFVRISCPIFIPSTTQHWPWTSTVSSLFWRQRPESPKANTNTSGLPLLYKEGTKAHLIFHYNKVLRQKSLIRWQGQCCHEASLEPGILPRKEQELPEQ